MYKNIQIHNNSIAIIGIEEGVAGHLHHWLHDQYHIACYINYTNEMDFDSIKQDSLTRKNKRFEYPGLDNYKNTPMIVSKNYIPILEELGIKNVIVAISDNDARRENIITLKRKHFNLISYIHPSAIILEESIIESGVIIFPQALIGYKAHIKCGVIIGTGATIEHHTILENYVYIKPRVVLAGNVWVNKLSTIEINTVVAKRVYIGKKTIIGASSLVLHDMPDNTICYGTPAKPIRIKHAPK